MTNEINFDEVPHEEIVHLLEGELVEDDELYSDDEFTRIVADRERFLKLSETEQEAARRWSEIEALREHYSDFRDFLADCMEELMGFQCSDLQLDIGDFLQDYEIQYGMIQAQRSQAKSTIVAIFAVWQLIHDCKHRILIVSAGSDVAMEIANWVIQIIMNWDILECMRPDRQHGDRASSKAFDIHWQLKGAEKSPSVACIGITANTQGRRADLLIPDDIESSKNGMTELQRAALEHLSKDFTSICQKGRIMYLGTPQTVDSIYKRLPERGYLVRVWTGRYPTVEEEATYNGTLAPYITAKMEADPSLRSGGGIDGTRGQAVDPVIVSEELLCSKERDQGAAYFNLQHMLNTDLSDADRYPLNCKDLIFMDVPLDKAPSNIQWLPNKNNRLPSTGYSAQPEFYTPFSTGTEMYAYEGRYMYVDTAGGGANGDETVATVTYFLHGYVFVMEQVALPGGYDDKNYKALSELAIKHGVNSIDVEKNFGFGAFAAAWRPILMNTYKDAGLTMCPRIEDVWESGQKELRIIDTLAPIMGRHKLIFNKEILDYDQETTKKYAIEKRESYKLFHQMQRVTRDKKSLIHDDRLDSLAGAVRKWVEHLAVDEQVRIEQKETDENIDFFAEWGGNIGQNTSYLGLATNRFQRNLTRRR